MFRHPGPFEHRLLARVIAGGVAVSIGLMACGRLGADRVPVSAIERDVVRAARAAGPVDAGRWTIEVSLGRSRIGPLVLSTTAAVRAPRASAHPWIEHEVVVGNVGRKVFRSTTREGRLI
jgi:hypothetical protein